MKELRKIMKYAGSVVESHHSWASLLTLVVEELGSPNANIKDAINEFIETKWS